MRESVSQMLRYWLVAGIGLGILVVVALVKSSEEAGLVAFISLSIGIPVGLFIMGPLILGAYSIESRYPKTVHAFTVAIYILTVLYVLFALTLMFIEGSDSAFALWLSRIF